MKTLDMTDSKKKGAELYEEIQDRVASTQLFIIQPYPSEVRLTPAQYIDLSEVAGWEPDPSEAEDRMIKTKHNVMEIKLAFSEGELNDTVKP